MFFLVTFAFPAIAATPGKQFIGYKHKGAKYGETLPNGATDLGGGLLSDENFGVTRFTKGKKDMLWLEKIVGRDARSVPTWEVKDVLLFEGLKKNQELSFSYNSGCTENGRDNPDWIVMTEFLPAKKLSRPIRAWRVNLRAEKFEEISTQGIECENDKSEKY